MPIRRISPQINPDTGKPVELNPPAGGSWIRDADGGLTPADEHTARSAGLWDEPEATPDAAQDAAPSVLPALAATKKTAAKE